jgi:hypothetical protein
MQFVNEFYLHYLECRSDNQMNEQTTVWIWHPQEPTILGSETKIFQTFLLIFCQLDGLCDPHFQKTLQKRVDTIRFIGYTGTTSE